jgi:hypothetical protein
MNEADTGRGGKCDLRMGDDGKGSGDDELLHRGPAVVLLFLGETAEILIHSLLLQSVEIATDLLIEQKEGRRLVLMDSVSYYAAFSRRIPALTILHNITKLRALFPVCITVNAH